MRIPVAARVGVPVAARVAVAGATDAFHLRLRAEHGLGPANRYEAAPRGVAYCGREFRVYPSMRIEEAVRFYSALHETWDGTQVRADLALAGLGERFEIKRMKRAFQRALVLALAMAPEPGVVVVEYAEEFDEPPARELLEACIERAPRAIVTYGPGASETLALLGEPVSAEDFERAFA